MGLNPAREQAPVILPRLHHHRKVGKLRRTVINVETVEIILEDALRRLTLIPTGRGINLHQHIESVDKDMTAAHAGVDDLDLFRLDGLVFLPELGKLRFYLRLLFGFVQIVFPAVVQFGIGVTFQPKSAEGVFHHIADDPVRREKLRCGGDSLFRDLDILLELGESIVFQLSVVILIQPADDLDGILPVLFGDVGNHVTKNAVLTENVVGQQHFRVAAHPLEHDRKRTVQGVALRQQQIAVEGFGVVALDVLRHLAAVQSRQIKVQHIVQDLRLERTGCVREHTDMGGQIVVDLHKAQGDKAVEPSVGNLFHDLFIALFLDLLDEFLPLGLFLRCQQPTIQGVRRSVTETGLVNSILIGTL